MDINNLLQTIIFMNIKDIGKMSYLELLPIILFSLLPIDYVKKIAIV